MSRWEKEQKDVILTILNLGTTYSWKLEGAYMSIEGKERYVTRGALMRSVLPFCQRHSFNITESKMIRGNDVLPFVSRSERVK